MKLKTFTLRTNLLSKLLLSLALLLIGGGNIWAQVYPMVVYNGGNSFPEGWTNSGFTISNSELVASGYTYKTLTLDEAITFTGNERIHIKARRGTSGTSQYLTIGTSEMGSSYTDKYTFYYHGSLKKYEIYSSDDYVELISDKLDAGTYHLQIKSLQINIKSIIINNDTELLLDEDEPTAILTGTRPETVRFKYSANNGWNSICVPFQLKLTTTYDHVTSIFGTDWKAYTLSSYSAGTLTFSNAAVYGDSKGINANTPCLVYAPNATTNVAGVELTSDVTIAYSNGITGRQKKAGTAIFQGTYVTKTYNSATDAENPWYGVTPAGRIMKAGQDPDDASRKAYVKGYHAYFTGVTAAEVKMMILDDDGGTTDLGFVKMVDENAKEIYNLAGQKVQKGRKGIYIVNGKKVVIK